MIDTHCHLTFDDFQQVEGGPAGVVQRAKDAGVRGMISISTSSNDCEAALKVAQEFDGVWCSSGVHPLYSHEGRGGTHDWARIHRCAEAPECVAWGELGLDYHYEGDHTPVQHAVLAEQLANVESWRGESEKLRDMPVVIHCREAFHDLIPILRDSSIPADRFVFHCFTAGPDEMRQVMDFGAMVSLTGVVTFKNAKEVREAVKLAPADRVMVETDAPFLTPAPHRKVWPNEPAYSRVIAEFLAAEIYGMEWETFEKQINENTLRFFGVEA
ncbi:MAG: TatD family hydrolase [Planctomycetota bacterium]